MSADQLMDAPIYRMTIYTKGGRELTTFGPKTDLQPLLDRWIEKDWLDNTVMRIKGHMDSCDQAEHLAGVMMDEIEIISMYLYA